MAKAKYIKSEIKTDIKPEKIKLKFTANCAYKFILVSNGDIVELDKDQADYCLNRGKCRIV